MKKSLPAIVTLFLLLALLPALSYDEPDSQDDRLVSRDYVLETFSAQVAESAKALLNTALRPLREKLDEVAPPPVFNGGAVYVKSGGSFTITDGQADLTVSFGSVVDATAGSVLTEETINKGNLYIVAENSLVRLDAGEDCTLVLDGVYAMPEFTNAAFADVDTSHWAFKPVETMAALSLVNGRGEGIFDPDSNMTRGELVTVLGRLFGIDTAKYVGVSFDDVDETAYYAPYVKWAADEGIVGGYGDGLFGPDDKITRAQLAVLTVRFAEKIGIALTGDPGRNFLDNRDIPDWARQQVYTARGAGLIQGREDGIFDPGGSSRRCEVCAILYRLITSQNLEIG